MSMTLFYTAITKDDFEAIRDGEKRRFRLL